MAVFWSECNAGNVLELMLKAAKNQGNPFSSWTYDRVLDKWPLAKKAAHSLSWVPPTVPVGLKDSQEITQVIGRMTRLWNIERSGTCRESNKRVVIDVALLILDTNPNLNVDNEGNCNLNHFC